MNGQTETHNDRVAVFPAECCHLPLPLRRAAALRKYSEAVRLYASSPDLTLRAVAGMCGVTATGLSCHIRQHHRGLLLQRYGLDPRDGHIGAIAVKPRSGQSLKARRKYRAAIEACGDIAYIELNVTQVARMFSLSGPALAAQLRVHYPDVIPAREQLRQRLGLADNVHRGARKMSDEVYASALEMYRDTDLTIPAVAALCKVPAGGLTQYLRFYHKDVIAQKRKRRSEARFGERLPGTLSGNGAVYGPKASTAAQYAPAVELIAATALPVDKIAVITGVPSGGLKGYLRQWGKGVSGARRGAASKYAPALASLRENPRPVSKVAAEFGLNADVFRQYLRKHEPDLCAWLGMMRGEDGRKLSRPSAERYAAAVAEYASSSDTLRAIANRHHLTYTTLAGYIARNCPAAKESHRQAVSGARMRQKSENQYHQSV